MVGWGSAWERGLATLWRTLSAHPPLPCSQRNCLLLKKQGPECIPTGLTSLDLIFTLAFKVLSLSWPCVCNMLSAEANLN